MLYFSFCPCCVCICVSSGHATTKGGERGKGRKQGARAKISCFKNALPPSTIHPPTTKPAEKASALLKPNESRKSNDERSQPDSETSYDMVGAASGNPSNAPNSPREGRKADDDSDEDWE